MLIRLLKVMWFQNSLCNLFSLYNHQKITNKTTKPQGKFREDSACAHTPASGLPVRRAGVCEVDQSTDPPTTPGQGSRGGLPYRRQWLKGSRMPTEGWHVIPKSLDSCLTVLETTGIPR